MWLPLLLLTLGAGPAAGPDSVLVTEAHYRVYAADGRPASLDDVVRHMQEVEVVFLGEEHDDPAAHHLEAELLRRAADAYARQRPVTLSLEMFERDVQPVVDEYRAGLIRERDFRQDSRPWSNYDDYRPLVELARERGLAIVAANAPRRYVSRVGRLGAAGLDSLSAEALAQLAPLPLPPDPARYREKFDAEMREMMAAHGQGAGAPEPDRLFAAQALRDATMAHAISTHLAAHPAALVLHATGKFHAEGRLGTPEYLLHYRPGARFLVVTMRSGGFPAFDPAGMAGLGDFVILTDPSLPRTREAGFGSR